MHLNARATECLYLPKGAPAENMAAILQAEPTEKEEVAS